MKRRRERGDIQARIIRKIYYILPADGEPVVQPVVLQNHTRRRYGQCLHEIQGEGSKKEKDNLFKFPKYLTCCNVCHKTLCKVHSVLYCHA